MIAHFRQLFRYRALLWALVVRHLAMRYRGSILGFLWSFLNPLCLMLVYVLVFRYYIRFNQVPNYTVFLFCGLLPWLWVSSGALEGTSAVVSSGHLITKSMFPAHLLPCVAVLTTMINFILSLPILIALMLVFGMPIHWTLLLVPLVIAAQAVLLYGTVLALSAINVLYRDVQHIVGNLLTFLFFLCPILYPLDIVPQRFRFTMDLNPLALLTRFYQELILEGGLPSIWSVCYFTSVSLAVLVLGVLVFDRYREGFAELL
jgi:lipopolysaccharide transport system permease protein